MKNLSILLCIYLIVTGYTIDTKSESRVGQNTSSDVKLVYTLSSPKTVGTMTVEEALANRRSRRAFTNEALSEEELSQIVWAAYGVTKPVPQNPRLGGGLRTTPSAGALYPMDLYVIVGNVTNIESGVYKYSPKDHSITRIINKDIREDLAKAAYGQTMIKDAPASLLYSAIFSRTTQKYGDRGRLRYVCMDIGHSGENVYLQAEALKLGTCAIGAFNDPAVSELMQLSKEEEPMYIMPFGRCK